MSEILSSLRLSTGGATYLLARCFRQSLVSDDRNQSKGVVDFALQIVDLFIKGIWKQLGALRIQSCREHMRELCALLYGLEPFRVCC
jgi:hypothetical protein